jgi:hypothetical protein
VLGNGYGGAAHSDDLLGGLDAGHPAAQPPGAGQPPLYQQQYQQQQYAQPPAGSGLPQYGAPSVAAVPQQGAGVPGGMRPAQQGPPPGQAKSDPFANLL